MPKRREPRVAAPRKASSASWLPALLLVALTIAAYLPAIGGGFVWDDDSYVTQNATLRSLAGLRAIWFQPGAVQQYYPMTFSTLWLEHQVFDGRALGYHLDNVLLHAASTVVLWRILVALAFPGAWIVAAVFALHPLHVESVAWIVERKNVLSGLLYLLAAYAYLGFVGLLWTPAPAGVAGAGDRRWYAASLVLFVAALLSKTVVCSLPAALLLVLWWRRGRVGGRDLLDLLPFFAVGLLLAAVTVFVEREHVGAAGSGWTLSLSQRVLVAGRALWFYAMKLLLPYPLVFIYPRWNVDASAWWQSLFPTAAVAVVAILFAARDRIGRGPLCGVVLFAGTLLPTLGFFDVYQFRFSYVADHFCYLASIGLIAVVVGAMAQIPRLTERVGQIAAAAVLAVLAALVWQRGAAYASAEALWLDTLARNPLAWIARNNLGAAYLERGRLAEAAEQFEAALRIKPDLDDAQNNLGTVALMQGRRDEAREHFLEAVRINPDFAAALINLATALLGEGRVDEAIGRYRKALASRTLDVRVQQSLPAVHANLGMALESKGDVAGAMAEYREALRLDPGLAPARQRLAALQGPK